MSDALNKIKDYIRTRSFFETTKNQIKRYNSQKLDNSFILYLCAYILYICDLTILTHLICNRSKKREKNILQVNSY